MESILKDEMVDHLEKNNLLAHYQHGFRKGRSVTTNLLLYMEKVTEMIDLGLPVDVVYFDFSKAFDKVPHEKLVEKLSNAQIGGKIKAWIKQWLSERKQRVVINGSFSSWVMVLSGVPQGSVLGPILFLIFVNDLGEVIACLLLCFADDTKLIGPVGTNEDTKLMQRDINSLYQWTRENGMEFNDKKCAVLHMGRKNEMFDYTMGGSDLLSSESEKDLGVLVQRNLKFVQHVRKVAQTCHSIISQVNRSFAIKDVGVMMNIYSTYILPHLDFASPVWNPAHKQEIEILEKVQRRFTRIIPELKGMNYEERLTLLELPSLEERRTMTDLVQCYRFCKGIDFSPDALFKEDSKKVITRSSAKSNFTKEVSKLDLRKNFFTQKTVNQWNKLPLEVQNARSLNLFKTKLKQFLF